MAATLKEHSCPKTVNAQVASTSNATYFAVSNTHKKGPCLYVPLPHQSFEPPYPRIRRSDSVAPVIPGSLSTTDLLPDRPIGTRGVTPQLRNAVVPAVVPPQGQGIATPYGSCTHPISTSPNETVLS